MRIAIAQINPTLGDFSGNAQKILQYTEKAIAKKAELIVFPECSLFGYHPFDLLERKEIVLKQEQFILEIHKKIPANCAVLFGAITTNKNKCGRPYFNSAVFLEKNKKAQYFHKQLLPTGDVFDEARFIEPGSMKTNFIKYKGKKFFISICEDIWAWPNNKGESLYAYNPIKSIVKKKVDLVINLSASPFYIGKQKLREIVCINTARHFNAPVLYANLVGAQDEIIFDGGSFVINKKGKKLLKSYLFHEDLNVFDLVENSAWHKAPILNQTQQLHQALVLGIQDFSRKTGLEKVHLGISGGIDSAVVAALAVDALGPKNVIGLAMPGPFSADLSLALAKNLAKNLNIRLIETPITDSYTQMMQQASSFIDMHSFGLSNENLQARLRGLFLMLYSNKENSLLLTTGNKSEYATGYSTLYGDMCGGLAPIADLTKKQVYEIAGFYNSTSEIIPREIITRAPSAELRPNQKDQDSLPEYELLDKTVQSIVSDYQSANNEIKKWLVDRLFKTEFKRWQAAPILKVSQHSFGRGRRYPIAHKAPIG